jgi:sugar (pentulose or hexulose) kinase
MVADIMNTPVICTEQSEAAALGAAIQAAWCKSWSNGHEDFGRSLPALRKLDLPVKPCRLPPMSRRSSRPTNAINSMSQPLKSKQHVFGVWRSAV